MKKYITSILLSFTIPLGELHTFWHGSNDIQNWILSIERPMSIDWNIKFAVGEIIPVLWFIAWVFYVPNKINKAAVFSFVWLSLVNVFMYFLNYKTEFFTSVYIIYSGVYLLYVSHYYRLEINKWVSLKYKTLFKR